MPRRIGLAVAVAALLLGSEAAAEEASPKPPAASECRKSNRCTPTERELGGRLADSGRDVKAPPGGGPGSGSGNPVRRPAGGDAPPR